MKYDTFLALVEKNYYYSQKELVFLLFQLIEEPCLNNLFILAFSFEFSISCAYIY